MNIRRLRSVQKAILKYPERFDISTWFDGKGINQLDPISQETLEEISPVTNCGTTACIAGWAISKYPEEVLYSRYNSIIYQESASIILDLTHNQGRDLFHIINWPNKYHEAHSNAKSPQERAQVASDYIDYFIEEEGR